MENAMDARVLIVEDRPRQLRGIKALLENIPLEDKVRCGIGTFTVDTASAADEAREALFRAKTAHTPYDIMLLDLSLPSNMNVTHENIEEGLQILDEAMKNRTSEAIIIISVFDDYAHVARAFIQGAVDFIAKPYGLDDLQRRFIKCWNNLLRERSQRIIEDRLKTLFPHAEAGLAYRFGVCFSKFLQNTLQGAERVEHELGKRFGLELDSDTSEPLAKHVTGIKAAIKEAREEWQGLQVPLGRNKGEPRVESIEALLSGLREDLAPCLITKQVGVTTPTSGSTQVLSFDDDVAVVLREIIAGGLSEQNDSPRESSTINVQFEQLENHICISFTDTFPPISRDHARLINEMYGIAPDPGFGRIWGLLVVQHIAWRGGGRLEVDPQEKMGNIIKYYLPVHK
ncbi:MAG TPA: response regulator [Candidatus Hydrogenedentes bacterium]|nr:response regulator [Candidatus Hydrogenedentota bacterium]